MEVIAKDNDGPKPSANELPKYVSWNLTPWEAPKGGKAYSNLYVCSELKNDDEAKKGGALQGLRGLRRHNQRPKHPS